MAILRSSDGVTFEVDEAVVQQLQAIEGLADNEIPLPNVTGNILAKVIEYCRRRADNQATADEFIAWDTEFVDVDLRVLFDLILAANYLNIKSLFDLTCQTVADMLKGKNLDEMRIILGAENDYTPEEEEEVQRENPWAFE